MEEKDIKKYCLNPPYPYQGYIAGEVRLSGTKQNCCSVQLGVYNIDHPNALPNFIPLRFWDDLAREFAAKYKFGDMLRVIGKLCGKWSKEDKKHYTYLEVIEFGPAVPLTDDE